jgi:hypothetical protein
MPDNLKIQIDNNEIEIVQDYTYLGICFARSGSFLISRKYLQEKATKAIYGLLQKCRKQILSIECQFDMFDKTILPMLLWGFENIDIIEGVHLRFCRLILRFKQSTPNFMVYGELAIGRYPNSVILKVHTIRLWCRVLNGK